MQNHDSVSLYLLATGLCLGLVTLGTEGCDSPKYKVKYSFNCGDSLAGADVTITLAAEPPTSTASPKTVTAKCSNDIVVINNNTFTATVTGTFADLVNGSYNLTMTGTGITCTPSSQPIALKTTDVTTALVTCIEEV